MEIRFLAHFQSMWLLAHFPFFLPNFLAHFSTLLSESASLDQHLLVFLLPHRRSRRLHALVGLLRDALSRILGQHEIGDSNMLNAVAGKIEVVH